MTALLVFLAGVFVLIAIPVFLLLYRAPSCFDGKLNGDETGIDCGGECQLLCTAESLPLIVRGDPRVLTIATSTYEVIALVENPNAQAEILRAGYKFTLYGKDSVTPVKTIEGEAFVPKGKRFALFEGPFAVESGAEPVRAVIEWKEETLNWQKNTLIHPELRVKDTALSRTDSSPRIEAVIENASLEPVSVVDLVALVSDENGNIFAASKTLIDSLPSAGSAQAVFTWPQPFSSRPVNIDIYIRILPDRSFIR